MLDDAFLRLRALALVADAVALDDVVGGEGGPGHLIAEAQLYRYPTASERAVAGESPIDADNHALSALRYLVSKVDVRYMAQLKRRMKGDGAPPEESEADQAEKARERLAESARAVRGVFGFYPDDDHLWDRL
jgi:hypothetical protein